jgi:hypothetical protein
MLITGCRKTLTNAPFAKNGIWQRENKKQEKTMQDYDYRMI